jgi:hypothetical protein
VVELQLPKLAMRVRFPSPAPVFLVGCFDVSSPEADNSNCLHLGIPGLHATCVHFVPQVTESLGQAGYEGSIPFTRSSFYLWIIFDISPPEAGHTSSHMKEFQNIPSLSEGGGLGWGLLRENTFFG